MSPLVKTEQFNLELDSNDIKCLQEWKKDWRDMLDRMLDFCGEDAV